MGMTESKGSVVMTKHSKNLGEYEYDFRTRNLLDLLISDINGKYVMDVGSGAGNLLNMLRKKNKVIGLEPDSRLRNLCLEKNPHLNIIHCKAEDLNSDMVNDIEVATMIDVLEHIEDDYKALKNVNKVMQKGGVVIINVPCYEFLWGKKDIKYGHFRRYTRKSLKNVLEKNGFEIVKMRYWNMILLLPYIISEKLLNKELDSDKRYKPSLLQNVLNWWFKKIENNINFCFGLNLIVVGKKVSNGED